MPTTLYTKVPSPYAAYEFRVLTLALSSNPKTLVPTLAPTLALTLALTLSGRQTLPSFLPLTQYYYYSLTTAHHTTVGRPRLPCHHREMHHLDARPVKSRFASRAWLAL